MADEVIASISMEQVERLIAAVEQGAEAGFPIAETVSGLAVLVSLIAAGVTLGIFRAQQKAERRRYVAQLHLFYWSEDFKGLREQVYRCRDRWLSDRTACPLIAYLRDGRRDKSLEEDWARVARLLFFFADLDRFIDNKIVERDLALEMFGQAQYGWFKDFFADLRAVVEEAHGIRENPPSWIARTLALEAKITDFERER